MANDRRQPWWVQNILWPFLVGICLLAIGYFARKFTEPFQNLDQLYKIVDDRIAVKNLVGDRDLRDYVDKVVKDQRIEYNSYVDLKISNVILELQIIHGRENAVERVKK